MVDEKKFLKTYDELADAIFRHCYFRVYDRETARDLTQETFIKTWEYLAAGKDILNLKAFLYRVATNMIIDHSRRKKPTSLEELREESGFDISVDTRGQLADQIDVSLLAKYLDQMDEKYRQAVVLRYIDDLSPQEIGEITGETANNISVRIHRGLDQLKIIIKAKNHDPQ